MSISREEYLAAQALIKEYDLLEKNSAVYKRQERQSAYKREILDALDSGEYDGVRIYRVDDLDYKFSHSTLHTTEPMEVLSVDEESLPPEDILEIRALIEDRFPVRLED